MLDFIGREICAGDWVAAGGGGNSSAEYGMILSLVREVTPEDKLKLTRLKVVHSDGVQKVKVRNTTAANSNRYVVVEPSAKVQALFQRALQDKLLVGDVQFIANWVHGTGRFGLRF